MNEERKFLIEQIKDNYESILERDNSGKGFKCPLCNSGTGANGTGMTLNKKELPHKKLFTCWACEKIKNDDVISIIKKAHNLESGELAIKKACEMLQLEYVPPQTTNNTKENQPTQKPKTSSTLTDEQLELKQERLKSIFLEAHKDLLENKKALEYATSRGLSIETLKTFKIGYIETMKADDDFLDALKGYNNEHPTLAKYGFTGDEKGLFSNKLIQRRLIIPTSELTFTARSIANEKPKVLKEGASVIMNVENLTQNNNNLLFITEGEIDGLSVFQALVEGFKIEPTQAKESYISLCSTSNSKQLITKLIESNCKRPLALLLDNDEPGDRATKQIIEHCRNNGIKCLDVRNNLHFYDTTNDEPKANFLGCKDLNECQTLNKQEFYKRIIAIILEYRELEQQKERERLEEYQNKTQAFKLFDTFKAMQKSNAKQKKIKTGFNELDKILDGGLKPGLYFLGAISSLGKTTFLTQVAENIAEQGNDILFFSLEMGINELIAKSISRITARIEDRNKKGLSIKGEPRANTSTLLQVLNNDLSAMLDSDPKKQILEQAYDEYLNKYARNLYFIESVGAITVNDIKESILEHIERTGNKPTVIIDYIQIIKSSNDRMTDKQATDFNVMILKQISRDLDIAILGISSFNRDNYSEPVNLASFKESGAIEYSSDILLALQYEPMNFLDNSNQKKTAQVRFLSEKMREKARYNESQQIELKILKNRTGGKGSVYLDFFAWNGFFKERKEPLNEQKAKELLGDKEKN